MKAVLGHVRSGPSGLIRQRLLKQMEQSMQAGAVVLCAPFGFGKTTLLDHYARSCAAPVSWLSADSRHVDPAIFVSDLSRQLRAVRPDLPDTRDVNELLNHLTSVESAEMLMVIDDVHCLANSSAETTLERLLVSTPSWLKLAIGTRWVPGFNLARYELSGLDIIGAEQLRFRVWETEQLLSDIYREPLPPTDIASLERRVGGWPAGLHLYHLSTRGRTLAERRIAVAALDGRTAVTRSYLARTILAELPVELRDFLVKTSVFDVLTAKRCDELLGVTGSWRLLEELERRQAFTTSSDSGRCYRYHQAMRCHLIVTLAEEVGNDAAGRWHLRAAELLRAEGALAESARAYARAEEWPMVRQTLDRIGVDIVEDDLEPWRELLPDGLVAGDPWLVLAEGRQLFSRGKVAAAIQCLTQGEKLFSDETGRTHCRQAIALARTWLPGPARGLGHWTSWLRAATQRHPGLIAAQAENLSGEQGALVKVVAHILAGEQMQAGEVLSTVEIEGDGVVAMALRLCREARKLFTGDTSAGHRLTELAAECSRKRLPWLARMSRAAAALDRSEEGVKEATRVAEECARDDDSWGAVIAASFASLFTAGSGGADLAGLDALIRNCRELDAGVLESWARSLHALAMAEAGFPDADSEAANAAAFARSAGVPGAQAIATAATARLGGGQDQISRARHDFEQCGLSESLITVWLPRPGVTTPEPAPAPAVIAEQAPVGVLCLGGFQMYLAGRPLDWLAVKPRVRVLMRLLAMYAGHPVHREVLANALWPDAPTEVATHSLHVALSSLRKLLEPGAPRGRCRLLVREGDAYRLALPDGGYSDIQVLQNALRTAQRARLDGNTTAAALALRAVLDAYGGDLLPEDGAAEWVVNERERLRHNAADAGVMLAGLELANGDPVAAAAAANRSVTIDRYHDRGWRSLINVHEQQGDHAAARDARTRYARVLAELGLDPAVF